MNFQQPSMFSRVMPIKMGKDKPMTGGKWEIVKEFRGNSHKDGGIDIEVGGGYVRHINSPNEKPDVIAKNGRIWKDIGAAAYGAGEGLLDTITMGATGPQQPLNLGPVQQGIREATPFVSPSMMRSYGQLGGQMRSPSGPSNQSGYSNIDGASPPSLFSGGGEDGPIMFRQQPLTQEAAFNYLSRYGINS